MYNQDGCVLGCSGIHAAVHPTDKCGSNGLPLVPHAIRILGRAQRIIALDHPNLCQYLHVKRGSQERVFFVTEFYESSVADLLRNPQEQISFDVLRGIVHETCMALDYLHERGIVVRNLCPEHLRLTAKGSVKLASYGLFEMCECGHSVNFPIGVPGYMSPELIASGPSPKESSPKEDSWAVGIMALELYLGHELWPDLRLANGTRDVVALLNRTAGVSSTTRATALHAPSTLQPEGVEDPSPATCVLYLKYFARGSPNIARLEAMPRELQLFIYACLSPLPSARPVCAHMLDAALFAGIESAKSPRSRFPGLACADLGSPLDGIDLDPPRTVEAPATAASVLEGKSLRDVFHLWTLAGGDVELEMTRRGLLKTQPPILHLPRLVRLGQPELKGDTSHLRILDDRTYALDATAMMQRLSQITADQHPLLLPWDQITQARDEGEEGQKLPLLIRERDIDYQSHRINVFTRLLKGIPFTRDLVVQEAKNDVPPYLRGQIWAAILLNPGSTASTSTSSLGLGDTDGSHLPASSSSSSLQGSAPPGTQEYRPQSVRALYETLDLLAPHPTDRQLEVDIPRCHQYDPLLSSPAGHAKLKRVLKAWILANPTLVYWQGLDSLSAPFIKLHFNDEATAFACLHNFVLRYLSNFFKKDNSQVMQEYLAVFWHLLAYIDPELSYHLNSIGFVPDLFAIPWCLTCFAHVFPLEKIYHMWDTLILHTSNMTVCIAVAILMQSRETLLAYDFNECILHFSDSPDVDMSRILVEAERIYKETPMSIYARQFSLGVVDTPHKSGHGDQMYEVPPIPVLRAQPCGTMSLSDFMSLYLTGPGSTPGSLKASRIVAIDIRSAQEYATGQLAACCINIPAETLENAEAFAEELKRVKKHRGRHIVVVGKGGKSSVQMAEALIKAAFPKVSILSEGISGLRVQGLLVKPAPPASGTGQEDKGEDIRASGASPEVPLTPTRPKMSSQSSFAKFMGLGKE